MFLSFYPPMAKGGATPPPSTGFSSFSQKWEELLLQTKFLPVISSLGHLSMKKKLDKGRVLGGQPPIEQTLIYSFNHEDDIQS